MKNKSKDTVDVSIVSSKILKKLKNKGVKIYGATKFDDVTSVMAGVPIELIQFNEMNPNEMDLKQEAGLRTNIAENKFLQLPAVFYNKKTDEFTCIDGEHRIKIVSEKNAIVPVLLVVDGLSEMQAFSGAFTFNRFRGTINQKKLSNMLQFGISKFGEKQVAKLYQLQKYHIDELLANISNKSNKSDAAMQVAITDNKRKEAEYVESMQTQQKTISSTPIADQEQIFMVFLPTDGLKLVNDTLKSIDANIPLALISICKFYKRKNKSEIKKTIKK